MLGRIGLGVGLMLALLAAMIVWVDTRTTQYDEIIAQAASRYDVDFYLVKALVYEESWFRSDVRGASGELGLMQVSLGAAKDFTSRYSFPPVNEDRLLEPRMNIEVGCWYLRQSLDRYKHAPAPAVFALLRYNAGETRADNWLRIALANPVPAGIPPERYYLSLVDFPTSRDYVRRILARSRSHNYWF